MLSNNDKKLLFIQSLNQLESIDDDTKNQIMMYHSECYPVFESESGLIKGALGLAIMGIGCIAGGPIAVAVGLIVGGALTGFAAYDAYTGYYAERDNMEKIASAVSSFSGSPVVSNAAKTTANIFQETKGNLVDKMNAIGELFEDVETLNETHYSERYSSVYGFDSDLNITDPDIAEEHTANYFYLTIGMDSTGKKIINQEKFNNAMKGFEAYWNKHKSFHFTDSGEAENRKNLLKRYISGLYAQELPSIKEKIELARAVLDNGSNTNGKRGMTDDGQVYDKKLYYSSMGFDEDGNITNLPLFIKWFKKETGLDENYNPINDKGKITHAKIYGGDEVLQYVSPATFLMLPEDVEKQIKTGRERMEKGEVQTTSLRKQYLGGFDRLEQGFKNVKAKASKVAGGVPSAVGGAVGNASSAVGSAVGNAKDGLVGMAGTVSDKAKSAWSSIKDGASGLVSSGKNKIDSILAKAEPLKGRASDHGINLIERYKSLDGKEKDMLMFGYIKLNGKSYRLCDDDIYLLQSYIRDHMNDNRHDTERRKELIRRGIIKTDDMTPDEKKYAKEYFKDAYSSYSKLTTR